MSLPILPSIGSREGKMTVFTIEECEKCSLKTKRPFEDGDYVFKDGGACSHCKSPHTRISSVHAEHVRRS
jgi:hypothetical protein